MKFKIGFIGSGARGSAYAINLKKVDGLEVEYTAICDANPEFRQRFNALYADGRAALYADYREMLSRHGNLDGVVICTPNHLHEETAVASLGIGAHILLEKPLEVTPQACRNILKAAERHRRSVTLGFVLRYTPFYRKFKELIDGGHCGQILTVNAEEIVNTGISRLFFGGWRRKAALSGGTLLEKCCHDLDIFTFLLGRLPVRVQSFGGRKAFTQRAGTGPRCRECGLAAECPCYFNIAEYSEEALRSHEYRWMVTWDDTCVYSGDTDICDHQTVNLEYADGAVLSFTLTLGSDAHTRTIRVLGTEGRVEGDLATGEIRMGRLKSPPIDPLRMLDDGSGHHGGDGEICRSFARSMADPSYRPSATVEAGFHSAMIAFAAERSRMEYRVVELREMYREVDMEGMLDHG